MEEKLRSIIGRTHWSLLLRAIALGCIWLLLPKPFFAVAALGWYFVPFFRPRTMLGFLGGILLYGAFAPQEAWRAAGIALAFYLALGIRDFIFVDRESARKALLVIVVFFGSMEAYAAGGWANAWATAALCIVGALFGAGIYDLWREAVRGDSGRTHLAPFAGIVAAFVLLQMAFAVRFLPVNMLFRSSLLIVAAATWAELMSDHARHALTRKKLLGYASVVFAATALILAAVPWRL